MINIIRKILKKRNNFIVTDGIINNKSKSFLIDTGSEKSFIKAKNNDRYKENKSKRYLVKGLGGNKIYSKTYSIPLINICGIEIQEVEFIDFKSNSILFKYLNIDGIIGWDILKRFSFSLDFKNYIIFSEKISSSHFLINIPVISNEKIPVFEVMIDSQKFKSIIDTGSTYTYCNNEQKLKKSFLESDFEKKIILGINGITFQYHAFKKYKTVTFLNKYNFQIPKLYIEESKNNNMYYEVLLGNDFLKDKILTFNHEYQYFKLSMG